MGDLFPGKMRFGRAAGEPFRQAQVNPSGKPKPDSFVKVGIVGSILVMGFCLFSLHLLEDLHPNPLQSRRRNHHQNHLRRNRRMDLKYN
jgi:hypothetical protein